MGLAVTNELIYRLAFKSPLAVTEVAVASPNIGVTKVGEIKFAFSAKLVATSVAFALSAKLSAEANELKSCHEQHWPF